MNLANVSVVVTAFNEASVLARCLESVRALGEVIVVDSFSADDTVAIARDHGAVVFRRPYRSPPDQKNWAVTRARNDWVLVLDADEVAPPALVSEIAALEPGDTAGYWIRRQSRYLGRTIAGCGWQRDRVLRLYDRRRGGYPEALVHEEVELSGVSGCLNTRLEHTPYRDVAHHLDKIDAYTTRGARQFLDRGGRAPVLHMLTHPPARFARMYFLQRGFRDGYPGLVLCVLSAWSVFLKYAKAWELKRP